MSAPGRLRELADAATPGPWYAVVNDLIGGRAVHNRDVRSSELDTRQPENRCVADMTASPADARLIALTPELARWAADAAEDLRARLHNSLCGCPSCEALFELLARLDGIVAKGMTR